MTVPAVERLLDLRGRVALVTGAGGGIGAAIALRLAEAGADVAVHYRANADGARQVVEQVASAGRRARAMQADVAEPDEVDELVRRCAAELGPVSILINNAGIYPVSPLVEMEPAEWSAVLRVNLDGVHHCTRAVARAMIDSGAGGAVVNVASIEGEAPMPGHAHYTAAKAGVLMHTRTAAAELGGDGIRVNAVAPGLIGREGIEDDWPEGVAAWRAGCPLGRLGQAADVADACLFLASDAARWITGTTVRVDGGYLSRGMMQL